MPEFNCCQCKSIIKWDSLNTIQRSNTCPNCHQDLKCCLHCLHYDPSSQWECRESISEAVKEKDRANFCDFFQAKSETQTGDSPNPKSDLLSAAEALFKKK